ncbi:MAG: ATP-binding protein [bacterium]
MKINIFSKILAGYFLITVMLSVLIVSFTFRIIKTNYIEEKIKRLENVAEVVESRIYGEFAAGKEKELNEIVKELGEKTGIRITVIAADGRVMADSQAIPREMDNHSRRPEIKEVLEGKNAGQTGGRAMRFSRTVKENMLYSAMPILSGDEIKGVLRLSHFMSEIDALLKELRGEIIKITLLMLILSLAAAYFLARRFLNPVKQLGKAAEKIAGKDFDVNLRIETGDEFQEMAESFNFMKNEIKKLFSEITVRGEELKTIIESIKEGLLVVDNKGRIKISNDSFEKIAGTKNNLNPLEGRFYWECMVSPRFNELIEKAGKEKASIADKLEINGRSYLCSINHLETTDENVIIMYDITGIKEFEDMKKDFVANVSHELKTPLTAIKGFSETLETEVKNEDNLRYIEIIKRHTERLIRIVEDLLILSKIERKKEISDFAPLNIEELVSNTVRMFDQKMSDKGLDMKIYISDNLPKITGDEFRLEQMLVNLIDNAMKYTEKGSVSVSVTPEKTGVKIDVEDTGIGIPEQHVLRLFERFYVVDKSRSRKLGGTGLGLSIVKHIVLIHNGEIDIESAIGKGTRFTVHLPF